MERNNLSIVLLTTFLSFCTLYLPQPLLPALATHYGLPPDAVATLISVPMLLLGVLPLLFGFALLRYSPRTILLIALPLLAACNVLVAYTEQFSELLALRVLLGIILTAVFPALMTASAQSGPPETVRRNISWYVAATILGGFCGRLGSGAIAAWLGWQHSFVLNGIGVACCVPLIYFLSSQPSAGRDSPGVRAYIDIFSQARLRAALFTIFLFFLCYSAVLNSIPFRLVDLVPTASELRIASVYVGYLIGIAIALGSGRILALFGSQRTTLNAGFALFAIALLGLNLPSFAQLMIVMLAASAAFFLLHALLSGYINHHASGHSAAANGLYVSFYYAGGASGAWLAPLLYRQIGWYWLIAILCALTAITYLINEPVRHADPQPVRPA